MAAAKNAIINVSDCVDSDSRISFTWKIKNFSMNPLCFPDKELKSKNFLFKNYSCYLIVKKYKVYGNPFAVNIVFNPKPKYLFCIIYLIGKNNEKKYERQVAIGNVATNIFQLQKFSNGIYEYPAMFVKEIELGEVMSKNCLTVVCELMISDVTHENSGVLPYKPSSNGLQDLSRHFGRLLTSKRNADVYFRVEGKDIPAHSQILTARSHIFADMFVWNMVEHQTEVIYINDCGASTVNYLLRYLYTGEMPDVGGLSFDILTELYSMAEKYAIIELKNMCSHTMTSNLSEDNVKMYATLAQKYNDQLILGSVVSFLAKHPKLRNAELWNDLKTIIPDLADQVLRALAGGVA